ncbi:MAG: hypothetical protein PHY43_07560 [Verrucomicrobiales bacterium]|nr:hypothetical protein [Verrucomicrobiales bacterium]
MKVEILNLAEPDILDGFSFYESQEPGWAVTSSKIFMRTLIRWRSTQAFI